MNPNKALWERGDFAKIAAFMRESGEAVVRSLEVTTPLRVLDLGCGNGTTALPLAYSGASIVGIDIASNLVAAGNTRAAAAGPDRIRFQEGDAVDVLCVSIIPGFAATRRFELSFPIDRDPDLLVPISQTRIATRF